VLNVQRADLLLSLAIGCQVSQVPVVIAVGEQNIPQRSEDPAFIGTEVVGEDQVESCPGFGFVIVMPVGVVPGAAILDLFGCEAKQEEVFLSRLLGHFNGGSVSGADSQCSVHHELHVTGTAGLIAGG